MESYSPAFSQIPLSAAELLYSNLWGVKKDELSLIFEPKQFAVGPKLTKPAPKMCIHFLDQFSV